jgi:hypothetical protein
MRILLSIAVVLLAVIAALLALQTFEHPPDKWSYGIVAPKDDDLIETLDRLGSMGWEVVAARRATSGEGVYSTASYEMILKRRGVIVKSGALPPSSK